MFQKIFNSKFHENSGSATEEFQPNSNTGWHAEVKKVREAVRYFANSNINTKSTVITEIFIVSVTIFEIHRLAEYEDPVTVLAQHTI